MNNRTLLAFVLTLILPIGWIEYQRFSGGVEQQPNQVQPVQPVQPTPPVPPQVQPTPPVQPEPQPQPKQPKPQPQPRQPFPRNGGGSCPPGGG